MTVKTFGRFIGLALAGALSVGVIGCSELTGDNNSDSSSSDRVSTRDISGLPRGADMLESGHGVVSTRAPQRGMIYLVDQDSGRLIWSGRIERGERFTVDADNDRAAIEGRTVYERNLERKDRHAVYFVPGSSSTYDRNYDRNRDLY